MGTLTGNSLILNRERKHWNGCFCFVFFFCSEDLNDFEVLTWKSPHDINTYFGLKLKPSLSLFQLVSLIKSEIVLPYVIESKLPWHIGRLTKHLLFLLAIFQRRLLIILEM